MLSIGQEINGYTVTSIIGFERDGKPDGVVILGHRVDEHGGQHYVYPFAAQHLVDTPEPTRHWSSSYQGRYYSPFQKPDRVAILDRFLDLAEIPVAAIAARRGEMKNIKRFYIVDELVEEDGPYPYGEDTVGIADEEQGGIIAYVHQNNAILVLHTLRSGSLGH